MLISIVVPHLNQQKLLERGLAALAAQRNAISSVEIIVTDNGSDSLPEEICARYGATLVRELDPGPGPARNRGVAEASGDILAFIDADCRADARWLAAIESAFRDPSVQVIGGDVRVDYADPGHPTFLEPYEAIYSYRNSEHIAEGYSGSGNLAVRREVFEAVGPFAGIEVAEDRDWGMRAAKLGFVTRYVPDMIIFHPARESFADLARKWDRHVAHDHEHYGKGRNGRLRWLLRAMAVGISPLAEIPRILTSDRVSGSKERLLAFACLVRIRLYRARRMLGLLFRGDGRTMSKAWNRD